MQRNGKSEWQKVSRTLCDWPRNPFRMAMDPNTEGSKVRFYVNDVGASTWEEISEGGDDWMNATERGWCKGLQNYGWDLREGPCGWEEQSSCDDYIDYIHPVHFYKHKGGGAATAAAFIPNGIWGEEYDGKYLWADFMQGWIQILDSSVEVDHCLSDCKPVESRMPVKTFTEYDEIITMRFGPCVNGQTALYYTSSSNGGVMRQVYCENCPLQPERHHLLLRLRRCPRHKCPPSARKARRISRCPLPLRSGSDCPGEYNYVPSLSFA